MRLRPILTPIASSPLHSAFGPTLSPDGAILHWDANQGTTELAGFGHDFQSLVLGNQYQLQADGSTVNIGATMPVDTIGGEKWLRSCGAVQNLLPSGAENFAGWSRSSVLAPILVGDLYSLIPASATTSHYYRSTNAANATVTTVSLVVKPNGLNFVGIARYGTSNSIASFNLSTGLVGSKQANVISHAIQNNNDGTYTVSATYTSVSLNDILVIPQPTDLAFSFAGNGTSGILVRNPILTATSYPVPYVPPGATQPATNATATNGAWFKLRDGSELWKALTGSPLTLATRVRMGVGSVDIGTGSKNVMGVGNAVDVQYFSDGNVVTKAYDWTATATAPALAWARNSIVRRVTQVNTSGTQFRVGYMIEGTHTAIQWGSWANFDSSFNPSTLYRLMFGYNNAYPMWFNKITAWRKQVSDAEIMEALS